MITQINIEKIKPHPQNPRLDLGDLTELTESIKEHGVMQNLTLVKNPEGGYTCVIGHRRLAAAKLAGHILTLPCQIVDMDEKEQIATMLMENMQRVDLTLYEQVQGFQTMMELNYSIADICEKTGLAETTVRHRLKMSQLDQDILKKKVDESEQLSINDIIKLEQIEDEEERNEVLENIGTNNFNWSLQEAMRRQGLEKLKKKIHIFIPNIEILTDKWWQYKAVAVFKSNTHEEELSEECTRLLEEYEGETLYARINYDCIDIRVEMKHNEEDKEDDSATADWKAKEEKRIASVEELDNLIKRMKGTWKDHIMNMSDQAIKDRTDQILKIAAFEMLDETEDPETFLKNYGLISADEEERNQLEPDELYKQLREAATKNPIRTILYATFEFITYYAKWYRWSGEYFREDSTEYIIELMEMTGYKFSDEEKQLMDGTHELYITEEQNG